MKLIRLNRLIAKRLRRIKEFKKEQRIYERREDESNKLLRSAN